MKILWVTNLPLGPLVENSKYTSGGWLDAAYNSMKSIKNLELIIVTVGKKMIYKTEGPHKFYILPGGFPYQYNPQLKSNRLAWEKIYKENEIDLIQIWGTEYGHGYLALQVMSNIPSVVYMQGLMKQIARHYYSGVSVTEQLKNITFRDLIKLDWMGRQKTKFEKMAAQESKILNLSKNVIVENDWCADNCKIIAGYCQIHKAHLNIREEFYSINWDINNMHPKTIMCNAGGYPIKGFHILLNALKIVVNKYPQTKLFVPGVISPFHMSLRQKLSMTSYQKMIKVMLVDLSLKDNVVFLPPLKAAEMAKQMAVSNLFVMPSSIENHSSTLIESMIVGTPSVSSWVGGIPEYLEHKVNGLLYRFEEYEILASNILSIFESDLLANTLSKNAKAIRNNREKGVLANELLSIYNKIIQQNKC